jgi:hypothetical protein
LWGRGALSTVAPQGWRELADGAQAPAFAAGMVFVSATIDQLTCQTFYNRHLLSIVSALAEGGGTARTRHQSQLLQVRLVKVCYSDEKVANRDTNVWHGATENGP